MCRQLRQRESKESGQVEDDQVKEKIIVTRIGEDMIATRIGKVILTRLKDKEKNIIGR